MKLDITNEAAKWYKEEFNIENDDNSQLRFFVRYGFGGRIPGFSLGISNDKPDDIYASHTIDAVTFFIERKDSWYFDDKDLIIQLNEAKQEPKFTYK